MSGRASDGDLGPVSVTLSGNPVKAAFATWRHVDPIRKTALECAVQLYGEVGEGVSLDRAAAQAIILANQFERYLTGEEANEPSHQG